MGGRGGKELAVHRSGLDGEQSNPSKSGGRDEVGTDGHWESFVTYQVHRLFKKSATFGIQARSWNFQILTLRLRDIDSPPICPL